MISKKSFSLGKIDSQSLTDFFLRCDCFAFMAEHTMSLVVKVTNTKRGSL